MMLLKKISYALEGLWHAITHESSLQLFCAACIAGIVGGVYYDFVPLEWSLFAFAALSFIAIELLNTAIERVVDVVEEARPKPHAGHRHNKLKQAKDVASAAAFVALLVFLLLVAFLFSFHIAGLSRFWLA